MTATAQRWWASGLDAALNLIYPPVCQLCLNEPATANAGYVGARCRGHAEPLLPPFCAQCGMPYDGSISHAFTCENCADRTFYFRSAHSAVRGGKTIFDVIHRYKYNRALFFEVYLAELLSREATPILRTERWDWIVPIPLHPTKEREREFNQAERLASILSKETKTPVNLTFLRRVKDTGTQTRLNRAQRAQNMEEAFAWAGKTRLNGAKIVLVDDVLTTGATTNACAQVLKAQGAGDICVWTVVRGT